MLTMSGDGSTYSTFMAKKCVHLVLHCLGPCAQHQVHIDFFCPVEELDWSAQSPDLNTFRMSKNTDCESDLVNKHEWEQIPATRPQNQVESLKAEAWRLLQQQMNVHCFRMTFSAITCRCNVQVYTRCVLYK